MKQTLLELTKFILLIICILIVAAILIIPCLIIKDVIFIIVWPIVMSCIVGGIFAFLTYKIL